jgi:hypothetical protein
MNTKTISQFKTLTLENGRGQTYSHGKPTLYGHSVYPRSSVLAGQPKRVWIEQWDTVEEALAELNGVNVKFKNMIGGGSSHVDVNLMVAHLPDGD